VTNATDHSAPDQAEHATALLANPTGGYRILPGGAAYCTGIIPDDGFEVVRVQLDPWLPLNEGYEFIEQYLAGAGRPIQAFCGIEMRLPAPLSRETWSAFNDPYLAWLRRWGLTYGDLSGVCRSNIAVAVDPPASASVCAFSYVRPAAAPGAPTFCLSGTADIDPQGNVIADGDTRPAAMHERARYTIDVIGTSLAQLGLAWRDAKQVAIFHVHDIPELWGLALLGSVGDPLRNVVLVYRARPPIAGGEVELEARGARENIIVATRNRGATGLS
jgi:hypothetical protein